MYTSLSIYIYICSYGPILHMVHHDADLREDDMYYVCVYIYIYIYTYTYSMCVFLCLFIVHHDADLMIIQYDVMLQSHMLV